MSFVHKLASALNSRKHIVAPTPIKESQIDECQRVERKLDLEQDVRPQHPAVAVAVRGGDDVGDPVGRAEPGHRQRLVEGRRPVIDAGQDVAV